MDSNVRINCETNGFEEATEQIETLANAYDGFPAQVTVKNCHHCTINIYPSQTKFADMQRGDRMSKRLIYEEDAIDAYIMKCPYFAGKNTIDRSKYGTHIGSCDLEHHYRKICPSHECLCAERFGLKNG